MIHDAISIWNRWASAEAPTLNGLERSHPGLSLKPLFPESSDYLVTDEGLLVRLPVGAHDSADVRIQSLGVCVEPNYFAESPYPPHCAVKGLRLFGIDLMRNAALVVKDLKQQEGLPLELMADTELFTAIYDRCVVFEFMPEGDFAESPEKSRLATVQFNYGHQYSGSSPLRLET